MLANKKSTDVDIQVSGQVQRVQLAHAHIGNIVPICHHYGIIPVNRAAGSLAFEF